MPYEIINFDEKEIEKFLKSIDKSRISKLLRNIDILAKYGKTLSIPYSKKLEKDLWELRISGKQNIRVIYTFKNNQIIILYLFLKKSNKTPVQILALARNRLTKI
jgi:phage-related protein